MAFISIAPQQSRNAGTVQSAWRTVPNGSVSVALRAIMDTADIEDLTFIMPFTILGSFDDGTTPFLLAEGVWNGGRPNRDNTFSPPTLTVKTNPMPTHMQAQAILPRTTNLGLEAEIL